MKRHIDSIIIHCSDSDWGDFTAIDEWHRERGWDGCGYHYIITNGVIRHGDKYTERFDGVVQRGRDINKPGAHCKGHNSHSIGICLIGRHHFTAKQLFAALPILLVDLMNEHNIPMQRVTAHHEHNSHKTCPNIDPTLLRHTTFKIIEKELKKQEAR